MSNRYVKASKLSALLRRVRRLSINKCPNCETELELVHQCGDLFSCAGCKEFFTSEYLKTKKRPRRPWNISSADGR